jgi:hypothetical protein
MLNFMILIALLASFSKSPDKLADLEDLDILYEFDVDTFDFYWNNLEGLWGLGGRFNLKGKMATCTLPHTSSAEDYDSTVSGIQHPVVVAINNSLEIIGTKAALPCPPHCSGGKVAVTFRSFMTSH